MVGNIYFFYLVTSTHLAATVIKLLTEFNTKLITKHVPKGTLFSVQIAFVKAID
jgi:hypothetical protein